MTQESTVITVKIKIEMSDKFKQGDLLPSILFNLLLKQITRETNINKTSLFPFTVSDDLVIMKITVKNVIKKRKICKK